MTHDIIVALAVLTVAGEVVAGALVLAGLLRLSGVHGPWGAIRSAVWGYELWLAFVVTAIATGGSLFLSEVANFIPCELCWFQRIFMYPMAIVTLLAAIANDHRIARYLLPLPVIGGGIAVYHILVEEGVVEQTNACLVSAPGGCAVKWVDELGYVTIPVMALTGFILAFAFLLFAALDAAGETDRTDAGGYDPAE